MLSWRTFLLRNVYADSALSWRTLCMQTTCFLTPTRPKWVLNYLLSWVVIMNQQFWVVEHICLEMFMQTVLWLNIHCVGAMCMQTTCFLTPTRLMWVHNSLLSCVAIMNQQCWVDVHFLCKCVCRQFFWVHIYCIRAMHMQTTSFLTPKNSTWMRNFLLSWVTIMHQKC